MIMEWYFHIISRHRLYLFLLNILNNYFRSWQSIKFRKMPVTFVKIVGTHNTANEVSKLETIHVYNTHKQTSVWHTIFAIFGLFYNFRHW